MSGGTIVILVKVSLLVILALIPFIFGGLVNICTKYRKVVRYIGIFFAAIWSIVALLPTILILSQTDFDTITTINGNVSYPTYVVINIICGLILATFPFFIFYTTISNRTRKKKFFLTAIIFVVFYCEISIYYALLAWSSFAKFETFREELPIEDFYKNNPEADKNSILNIYVQMQNLGVMETATISVYQDSVVLNSFIFPTKEECHRNDLSKELVMDLVNEITDYKPETEYPDGYDICYHPDHLVELAYNQEKTTYIKLTLPDLDRFHPKGRRLIEHAIDLIQAKDIHSLKGCHD